MQWDSVEVDKNAKERHVGNKTGEVRDNVQEGKVHGPLLPGVFALKIHCVHEVLDKVAGSVDNEYQVLKAKEQLHGDARCVDGVGSKQHVRARCKQDKRRCTHNGQVEAPRQANRLQHLWGQRHTAQGGKKRERKGKEKGKKRERKGRVANATQHTTAQRYGYVSGRGIPTKTRDMCAACVCECVCECV